MKSFFKRRTPVVEQAEPNGRDGDEKAVAPLLREDQRERLDHDLSILDDERGTNTERAHRAAQKEVRTAAEDSLKKLHVIQMGRCPSCGEHLRRHLFASVCDSCGWHTFDVPREGPVRVHLTAAESPVEGDRCYMVKSGAVLVMQDDVVVANVPPGKTSWIEYVWSGQEIEDRQKQILDGMTLRCGWCGAETDPEKDGFHIVHVALGATQERYCFCCDDCYEAFRKMYPSRVHRDCYDRSCSDCEECVRRYSDDVEGLRMLAKDYLDDGRVRQG